MEAAEDKDQSSGFLEEHLTTDVHAQAPSCALTCVLFPALQLHPRSKKLISAFSNRDLNGKEGLGAYILISVDLSNPGLQVDRWGKSEICFFFFSIPNDCAPCLACCVCASHSEVPN